MTVYTSEDNAQDDNLTLSIKIKKNNPLDKLYIEGNLILDDKFNNIETEIFSPPGNYHILFIERDIAEDDIKKLNVDDPPGFEIKWLLTSNDAEFLDASLEPRNIQIEETNNQFQK